MKVKRLQVFLLVLAVSLFTVMMHAQPRLMENLGRGLIVVPTSSNEVYIGWRFLGTDPSDITFNIYRSTADAELIKLNNAPISKSTNFIDKSVNTSLKNTYYVRSVLDGVEESPGVSYELPADAPQKQYFSIPLQIPPGGTTPDNVTYTYTANDSSVGDLDGDGEYEIIVKWDPTNSKDNAQSGYTGNVYLDAYKIDGTFLWRIDLGKNIRAGAHYTQFMVYDLDGDGKAEIVCKTADGTIDGTGKVIGDPLADYRNSSGYILSGPEYLTIFNGQTGAELATVDYDPPRGSVSAWGDNYGNRVDRFLACIAYLDGSRPSLVMCRGYYTRTVLVAWNWRDGELTKLWTFDSDNGYANYTGQGNHNLSVADVDLDGKDEIIYGACAIDNDGTGLYSTGLGHGDAMHVTDLDPDRPGLEVWQAHEVPSDAGAEFRDAWTGELIWGVSTAKDNGRALAADIDPTHRGYEVWSAAGVGLWDCKGNKLGSVTPPINFSIWWDDDLLSEMLDDITISKWDWLNNTSNQILTAADCSSNNGTKATPVLSADLFGDWREEVIWRTTDNTELRIYTTTIPTNYRIYTLMQDPLYRLGITWQNVAYNQPPHTGFYLGEGMIMPPQPDIVTTLGARKSPNIPYIKSITADNGFFSYDRITNCRNLFLNGTADPYNTIRISRLDLGEIGTTLADENGNWTFDYSGTTLSSGTYVFTAIAVDTAGLSSSFCPYFSINIKTTVPSVLSINRLIPATETTVSGIDLSYRITFSEKVMGIDPGDFILTATGSVAGTVSAVSANSGTVIDVTVSSITGTGTLRLDLKNSGTGIVEIAGNAVPGFTGGQIYNIIVQTTPTWIQLNSGGLWSENSNWLNNFIGDGDGATINFNLLDLIANNMVYLDSPRTAGSIFFEDTNTATAGNWIIDNYGSPANTLNLTASSGSPTITVNAMGTGTAAFINAILTGTTGLTKAGTGTLVLSEANTLSGSTAVNAGTLRIDNGGILNTSSVNVASGGATLNINGGEINVVDYANVNAGSYSAIYVNSGIANFNIVSTNNSSGGIIQINGGTVNINTVAIPRSSDSKISYSSGFIVKGGTTTVGSINLGTRNSNGVMSMEGGSLTVTGPISLGNQTTGGRGGALRVIGGVFNSTDLDNGLIITQRAANASLATFTNGTSFIEKITMGYNTSVNSGSATLTIDGGNVYLGSGGMVKNGTGSFTSTINLTRGILGAKSNWSSGLDMILSSGNSITLKSADENNMPYDISLAGILSGTGGFTKTGGGKLILSGVSSYTGTTQIDNGILRMDGVLSAASGSVNINDTASLTGIGRIERPVILNNGGSISVGGPDYTASLQCGSLTWNAGGKIQIMLGNRADYLRVNGALTKGNTGSYTLELKASEQLPVGMIYYLVNFDSTNFTAEDFMVTKPVGVDGDLIVNANQIQFIVTKIDNEPPVLTLPDNMTIEATGPDGANVDFNASAFDEFDGQVPVIFSHEPGSIFPIGSTTVTVTASDLSQHTATGNFTIIVADTTGPVLTLPDNLILEATGPDGAIADFSASAYDIVDGELIVNYSQQPGSIFPLGTTIVTVTASDHTNNLTTGSFTVKVVDTTPPVLTLPSDIILEAAGPKGTAVHFSASAKDIVDGDLPVNYSHQSGSIFPLGTTIVTVTASDHTGNQATGTFTVKVVDTTPPVLKLPHNKIVEATSPSGAVVYFKAYAYDFIDGKITVNYSHQPGSIFPLGKTIVTVTAADLSNNITQGTFTITVKDTKAPVILKLTATPDVLWPANHKMVPVQLQAQVVDAVDLNPTTRIVSVAVIDYPFYYTEWWYKKMSFKFDRFKWFNKDKDWEITGDMTLNLRAEKSDYGNGRVYLIKVESRDASGNVSYKIVTVSVPKNHKNDFDKDKDKDKDHKKK